MSRRPSSRLKSKTRSGATSSPKLVAPPSRTRSAPETAPASPSPTPSEACFSTLMLGAVRGVYYRHDHTALPGSSPAAGGARRDLNRSDQPPPKSEKMPETSNRLPQLPNRTAKPAAASSESFSAHTSTKLEMLGATSHYFSDMGIWEARTPTETDETPSRETRSGAGVLHLDLSRGMSASATPALPAACQPRPMELSQGGWGMGAHL